MKCTIPEISWHNREPVLSVDIRPISTITYKLASGGGDCHVLIWQLNVSENGAVKHEVMSDLTRHQRAVNCVRWSPTGQYLASADDDANIIIWQQKTDNIPSLDGDTNDKETWIIHKILRGHKEDIYDVCWSLDELKLLSGSVDNTAILWDLLKGKLDHILCNHKGFVQGVAWDPKNQMLATISTDRTCRIFDTSGKQVKARLSKGTLPVPAEHHFHEKEVKFFHDDTFKSFFRRLQFSPDGSLLIVPSGYIEADSTKTINATLIFALDNWNMPAAILPLKRQSSTVVRCCPVLFKVREEGPEPVVSLPYRMIFAVGTDHDIILYDTQQPVPFARFQDIHYTRLTDLTWSSDGRLLVASSTDGFCSLITFEAEELGVPYVKEENVNEENDLEMSGCEELDKDENVDITNKELQEKENEAKKRPSFIEQWALKTPKRVKEDCEDEIKRRKEVNVLTPKRIVPIKVEEKAKVNVVTPKRITPIKIEETKKRNSGRKKIIKESEKEKISSVDDDLGVDYLIENSTEGEGKPEVSISEDNKDKEVEEKKMPRFIQQWASSSSKKSKTGENKTEIKDDSNKDIGKEKVNILIPKRLPSVKIEEQSKGNKVEGSKLTNVKRKTKENNSTDAIEKPAVKKRKEETECDIVLISDEESNEVSSSKMKKAEPTRIRVTSLINKTPKGNVTNPLLSFISKSSREKPKSKKQIKKQSKEASLDVEDLTLDENEARDAWKCDKELLPIVHSEKKLVSCNTATVEESCTADFTLQLEDSQEEENRVRPEIEKDAEDDKDTKNLQKCSGDIGDDVGKVDTSEKVLAKDVTAKMPRRVALITLSSPKSKKS